MYQTMDFIINLTTLFGMLMYFFIFLNPIFDLWNTLMSLYIPIVFVSNNPQAGCCIWTDMYVVITKPNTQNYTYYHYFF